MGFSGAHDTIRSETNDKGLSESQDLDPVRGHVSSGVSSDRRRGV